MNDNGRLEAVLAEYKAMREEIIRGKNREVQIYSIWIAFIGVFFGLVLGKDLFSIPNYDALLILPAFSSVFAFRFLWEHKVIRMVSDFIKDHIEEKKIPHLLGFVPSGIPWSSETFLSEDYKNFGKYLIGWQHYYYEKRELKEWKAIFTSFWAFSFGILMLISFGIPILYSLLILEKENFSILYPPLIPTLISILIIIIPLLIKKYKKRWEIVSNKWDYGIFSTPLGIIISLTVFLFLDKYWFIKKLISLLVCPNKIPLSVFSPYVHWLLVWIYLTVFCVIIILFLKERPEQENDAETKK